MDRNKTKERDLQLTSNLRSCGVDMIFPMFELPAVVATAAVVDVDVADAVGAAVTALVLPPL